MNFKHVFILLLALSFLSFSLPKQIQKKVNKAIQDTFEIKDFKLSPKLVPNDVAKTLPSQFNKDNLFEIKSANQLLGFAYISKAPSKTDDFDYLVLLDKKLIIMQTKVLVYREDYGGEIGSKRWLKQFIGKNQNDSVIYQDNIIAISGATISVKSMTTAMNNLLESLKILHSKQVL